MKPVSKVWIIMVAFMLLMSMGCAQKSDQTTSSGGGQVRLSGMVDTNGATKAGVSITATNIEYVPDGKPAAGSFTTFTDDQGYYAMTLSPGTYNVVAAGPGVQKAMRSKVRLSTGGTELNFVLTATGDLAGRITYYQSSLEGFIIFLYGTQFMASTDQNGSFLIRGVPVGTYRAGLIVPDEDGGTFPLHDNIVVNAGLITDMGTVEASEIERRAFIDYVDPWKIEESHDPNSPILMHRYELLDSCDYDKLGIVIKFEREMNIDSVMAALTIEEPANFEARNLHWEYAWGYYSRSEMNDNFEECNGDWCFHPSPCHLTIIPRTAQGDMAKAELPVGTYVIRLADTATDKCGNPLIRPYVYSFNMQEMMRWAINDRFLPNGATNVDVGEGIMAQFTNLIDQNTVDITITPPLQGQKIVKYRESILIRGLYTEGVTYTAVLGPGVKTIAGDPIVNTTDFTVQFTASAPRVAGMLPKNGSLEYGINGQEPVVLIFNTITDRDSVEKRIHVYDHTSNVEFSLGPDPNNPGRPYFGLTWVDPMPSQPDENDEYEGPWYGDDYEECDGCGLGSECGDKDCCPMIRDQVVLHFPRQYDREYHILLDANAVSAQGGKMAAFSGSFRTKIPRLVEWNVGESYMQAGENFWFRYNVNIDASEAVAVLVPTGKDPIQVAVGYTWGGEMELIPAQLPHATEFVLSLQKVKAGNGYVITSEPTTFTFSTPDLMVVGTEPYNGQANYLLAEDGSNQYVAIRFNGLLTPAMQDALEGSIGVTGRYYGPEVDPNIVPENYPDPLFVWNDWKYDWSELRIAFTMDPCTNYKIHVNTDPATGAVLYNHDQDSNTPAIPFLYPNRDLIFTTACPGSGEPGEGWIPPLVYRTEPPDGANQVGLDHTCIQIYLATPIMSGSVDLEVWRDGNHLLTRNTDYTVSSFYNYGCPIGHREPWGWQCDGEGHDIGQVSVCLNYLYPSSLYTIVVKAVQVDYNYDYPFEYNLPYTFSFRYEPPRLEVMADNAAGILQFGSTGGYFKVADFLSAVQPELVVKGWEFIDGHGLQENPNMIDYATEARMYYQPTPYALIKVKMLQLAWYAPEEDADYITIWNLKGTFANTPGQWVLNVQPDNVLPKLDRIEPVSQSQVNLYFNVPMDVNTALDPNRYTITYLDGNSTFGYIHVQEVSSNDSAGCPTMIQLMVEQLGMAEYSLKIVGVRSCSSRYELFPQDYQFRYTGRVEGACVVETADDIRYIFDTPGSPKTVVKKVGIHFDVPMDPNTIHLGPGQEIDIWPTYDWYYDDVWKVTQYWSEDRTTVVASFYYGDPNSFSGSISSPDYFNVSVSDNCRNAAGQKLTNTPFAFTYLPVDKHWLSASSYTTYFNPSDPPARIDISYSGPVDPEAAQSGGNYRLVDPSNNFSSVLDPNSDPVYVQSVDAASWPQCTLNLTGLPVTPGPVLVYSNIPCSQNWQPLPEWFPREALKDMGYTVLW